MEEQQFCMGDWEVAPIHGRITRGNEMATFVHTLTIGTAFRVGLYLKIPAFTNDWRSLRTIAS